MLTSSIIMAESDRLGGLIEILRDPDKYKKQIEELRQVSADAEEKSNQLVEERIQLQSLRNDLEEVERNADEAISELNIVMEKAQKVVAAALQSQTEATNTARSVIGEARTLVTDMQSSAKSVMEEYFLQADKEEQRLDRATKAADAAEQRLAEADRKLAELRSSL